MSMAIKYEIAEVRRLRAMTAIACSKSDVVAIDRRTPRWRQRGPASFSHMNDSLQVPVFRQFILLNCVKRRVGGRTFDELGQTLC